MAPTHKEILKEIMPLYQQNPERFMRFYHAVNNIIATIPEGQSIRIDEHCNPSSRDLFIKIASLWIIGETIWKTVYDDFLEFSDDYTTIRHVPRFIPVTNWQHQYSNRKKEKQFNP